MSGIGSLITRRLVLLPLSRAMMRMRLEHESFTLACVLPTGEVGITFPGSWPGDALAMFPGALERLPADQQDVPGSFTAVDHRTMIAVGQLGVVGEPGPDRAQEIGYGFDPAVWNQGLATEALMALAGHLLDGEGLVALTAKTAVSNPASGRVLEKAGFHRVGTDWDGDDGDLVCWQLPAVAELG